MSRNLCTSSCVSCGYIVRLSDLRGSEIEFRRYFDSLPVIGCRFDCKCGEVYFAIWRTEYRVWGKDLIYQADNDKLVFGNGFKIENNKKGRFYTETEDGTRLETGSFSIDLSYYESYNDEHHYDKERIRKVLNKEETPSHLCVSDVVDLQDEW